jgi:hypothetical protein
MSMRVRRQDSNGDMTFGLGRANFYRDQPEGVAQVVTTRLGLWLGEWFIDINDGTPWNTQVLGKYTGGTRDIVVRSRVLGTPDVTGIAFYESRTDADLRTFTVEMTIDTAYGVAKVNGPI